LLWQHDLVSKYNRGPKTESGTNETFKATIVADSTALPKKWWHPR